MPEHSYQTCPAKPEIENLKYWQTEQKECVRRLEDKLDTFVTVTFPEKLDAQSREFREDLRIANKKATTVTTWLYRSIIVALLGVVATLVGQMLAGG